MQREKSQYSRHPLSQTPTGLAKKFEIANVRDSGRYKIVDFYKALGKPNTVFNYLLTLVSLKGNRREKIYRYFYSIDILFLVEISQNAI